MIDLDTFHNCLAQSNARGYKLDAKQKEAVDYGESPLWLIAGPGSGKSEVLVTRTLKLLCVDGFQPGSIFLTTFTTKAARNLEDRLSTYLIALQNAEPNLKDIDLAGIRIGTLHSLWGLSSNCTETYAKATSIAVPSFQSQLTVD